MKKLALSALVLLALVVLAGCNGTGKSEPKVAVVDAAKVFQESAPGKAGLAYLETVSAAAQEEFKSLQTEAGDDKSQESMMKMQRALGQIQQRMNAEQQMVIGKLNSAFQDALAAYRAEKKLDVIIASEQALSFGPEADVTKDIIAAMDKMTLSFEPEKAPEAATEAPEAAAEKAEAPKADEQKQDAPAAAEGEKKE